MFGFMQRNRSLPSREMQRRTERGGATSAVDVTPRRPGDFTGATREERDARRNAMRFPRGTGGDYARELRSQARRALLYRQARREKSGFYDKQMSVASLLGQRFGHLGRQRDDATGKLVRVR